MVVSDSTPNIEFKKKKTIADYDAMGYDDAMAYLRRMLDALVSGRDYVLCDKVNESIHSIYKHATHDFSPMYVACIMHKSNIQNFNQKTRDYLIAYNLTFEYEGENYIATWSLHS